MTGQLHIEGLFENTAELWDHVLAALRRLPGKRAEQQWLEGASAVSLAEGELTVSLPGQFAKDFIERRCRQVIGAVLQELLGRQVRVRFVADDGENEPQTPTTPRRRETTQPKAAGNSARAGAGMPLNSRYQFSTFVAGEGSRFALNAALAVANAPGNVYNPLVICGGVGVGKTHLLQAIGHEVSRQFPSLRLAYVPADMFTYEFVSALRERKCDAFRKRYRTVDLWLVDDLQFIAQKRTTEEEFFLTFTALQETGKQIVLCCDHYPKDLNLLDDRLRTRLESGLIVEVGAPDQEARIAILRRKAEAEGVQIDPDVLLLVASLVQSNVRTLEGALIKLLAYSSLTGARLTRDLAHGVLEAYFGKSARAPVSIESIQQATCDFFGTDPKSLKSKRRDRSVLVPRQVAMYLSRQLTDSSLADIGSRFGGRDHSTVISACNKISTHVEKDEQLRNAVEEISRRLGVQPEA